MAPLSWWQGIRGAGLLVFIHPFSRVTAQGLSSCPLPNRSCYCLLPLSLPGRALPAGHPPNGGKMSTCGRKALTLLSSVFAVCGLGLLGIAVSTDYWLYLEEGVVLPQNQSTEVKMSLHSGLWRVCFLAGMGTGLGTALPTSEEQPLPQGKPAQEVPRWGEVPLREGGSSPRAVLWAVLPAVARTHSKPEPYSRRPFEQVLPSRGTWFFPSGGPT